MNRLTYLYSPVQCRHWDAKSAGPFLDCECQSIMRKLHAKARSFRVMLILVLYAPCRPLAIVFGISSVVVDSVKRRAMWAFSHVGQELLERFLPALAHRYSASTVTGVVRMLLATAPVTHCSPRPVSWRVRHSVRLEPFGMHLRPDTSARADLSCSQGTC